MIEVADSGQGIPDDLQRARARAVLLHQGARQGHRAGAVGDAPDRRLPRRACCRSASSEELGGAAIRVYLPLLAEIQAAGA